MNNKKGSFGSLFLFIGLILSSSLYAEVLDLAGDTVDVLTRKELQTDLDVVSATSKLEDQLSQECAPTKNPCDKYPSPYLSEEKRKKGWKVLFEVKYQGIPDNRTPEAQRSQYSFDQNLGAIEMYYAENERPGSLTPAQLIEEKNKIVQWNNNRFPGEELPPDEHIVGNLIFEQLGSSKNYNDLLSKVKGFSSVMSDEEYLRFLTTTASWVEYKDERAKILSGLPATKGVINAYNMVVEKSGGICGDIHTMVSSFAKVRGWESFMVGYALSGGQHVVSAIRNPATDKIGIVNYGNYEENSLNDGNSARITPSGNMQDVGTNLRILRTAGTDGADGPVKQIANIPTALGSFMNDLFKNQKQIEAAMPSNNNFNKTALKFETGNDKTIVKNDGKKIIERETTNGVTIYEGNTEDAKIYGVAVSHDVFKEIYFDGSCIPKKSKYFAVGVAGSLVNKMNTDGAQDLYYVYLNMKGGKIFHIYQTPTIQFKGFLGYELSGFFAGKENGAMTGDINLQSFAGVMAKYQKDGKMIEAKLTYETALGLKDERFYTDLAKYPTNVNPFAFNALALNVKGEFKLNNNNTLLTDNKISMTKVGSQVILSTGLLHNNTSIMLSYQGGMKAIPLSNSLQTVNLLKNFNNMDGFRLTAGQNFSNKKGSLSGTISGWAGMSTGTGTSKANFGTTLKLNLNKKKK